MVQHQHLTLYDANNSTGTTPDCPGRSFLQIRSKNKIEIARLFMVLKVTRIVVLELLRQMVVLEEYILIRPLFAHEAKKASS